MANQQQLRQKITAQIVAALESGDVPPWRRPWRVGPNAGSPANIVSRKPYRGINPILLDLASARHNLLLEVVGDVQPMERTRGQGHAAARRRSRGPVGDHDRLLDARSRRPSKDAEGDEKTTASSS